MFAVRASGLTKSFGDFTAVDAIDFEVDSGESSALLGPNGAGKSSTMKMLSTVSPTTSGELEVRGGDPKKDGRAIRQRLGVVSQEDNLDEELTVIENLMIHGRYFGLSWSQARAKATELLAFAQLSERSDDRVEPLSGGMKRRLSIARSLVNDPELVLLDEPTTGLDPQARHLLWERLYSLRDQGVTLILTTHYMDEAEQLADRLVVMDNGKIVAEGSPAQLISAHVSKEVLELRFGTDGPPSFDSVSFEHEHLADRTLVYSDDGDGALQHLRSIGIEPVGSFVRRTGLEDVFLALTGRSLVD